MSTEIELGYARERVAQSEARYARSVLNQFADRLQPGCLDHLVREWGPSLAKLPPEAVANAVEERLRRPENGWYLRSTATAAPGSTPAPTATSPAPTPTPAETPAPAPAAAPPPPPTPAELAQMSHAQRQEVYSARQVASVREVAKNLNARNNPFGGRFTSA